MTLKVDSGLYMPKHIYPGRYIHIQTYTKSPTTEFMTQEQQPCLSWIKREAKIPRNPDTDGKMGLEQEGD